LAKYRKKPVVVEAKEFKRENLKELEYFTKGNLRDVNIPRCLDGIMTAKVDTLEGVYTATEGDYIIKGIKGEFYPCKPDIFEQTYERVD